MSLSADAPAKLPTLADAIALLEPYQDHRTAGHAAAAILRVHAKEGAQAAFDRAGEIAACYEEIYLREAADGMAWLLKRGE